MNLMFPLMFFRNKCEIILISFLVLRILSSFFIVAFFKNIVLISLGIDSVEAKLHGESKVIQMCFDDNNDDNKR